MALSPGTRIGPYEVVGSLGAGGMGEVYRARDAKLARDVALKILLAVFASDAERLARFDREAQVLASVNHPHIAQIYGFEESGDRRQTVPHDQRHGRPIGCATQSCRHIELVRGTEAASSE